MYFKYFIIIIFSVLIIYFFQINYWEQIWENSKKRDYIKWILCDKLIAKKYAENNGFNVTKLYQYCKYPHQLKEPLLPYVVKPVDLCNSEGVYLMKNGINLIDNKKYRFQDIKKNLVKLRSQSNKKYYMTTYMYSHLVANNGYIVEELLLENNKMINDYKCYTFQGKVWFIACTYNRKIENGTQTFNSIWMTRDWKPIIFPMIKNGYLFQKLDKPKGLDDMISKVENISLELNRHCRIDVYLKDGITYFGEFTFFGGAFLHTRICNNILGLLWKIYPDVVINDKRIINDKKIINEIENLVDKNYVSNHPNDLQL